MPTHTSTRRVITATAVPATLVALAGAITFAGPAFAASGSGGSGTLPFPTAICTSGTPGTRAPSGGASPSTGASGSPGQSASPSTGASPSGSAGTPIGVPSATHSSPDDAPKNPTASPSASPSPSASSSGLLGLLGGLLGSVRMPYAPAAPMVGAAGVGKVHGRADVPNPTTSAHCVSSAQASRDAAKAKADTTVATMAANEPWHLSTPSMTMWGLTYDGVTTVDTPNGKVQVLDFTATKVTIDSMVTYSQQGGGKLQYNNGAAGKTVTLTDVTLLTTSLTADVLGVIHATFTPSAPPPLIPGLTTPIPILFTHVEADNAFMNAQSLDVPGFDGYGSN